MTNQGHIYLKVFPVDDRMIKNLRKKKNHLLKVNTRGPVIRSYGVASLDFRRESLTVANTVITL